MVNIMFCGGLVSMTTIVPWEIFLILGIATWVLTVTSIISGFMEVIIPDINGPIKSRTLLLAAMVCLFGATSAVCLC